MLHPNYRADIDGLRAIAVLAVVLFHGFPDVLPGGFIGVDVFFVISGYLITGIVVTNLEAGSFSFLEFYSKRIRRIFPALLTVLLASLAIGWLLLLPEELRALGKHIAGGAAFVANILYWQESGYFDTAADSKPLLHFWSLGIEEQYYLVWPALLWLAWRLRLALLKLALVFCAASFAVNLWLYQNNSVADFFSPISRFWELGIGAMLACIRRPVEDVVRDRRAWLAPAALALLFCGFFLVNRDRLFPGWWALIPTLSTAVLLWLGEARGGNTLFRHPMLTWFGSISYPLYLWHWPVLVFGVFALGPMTAAERLAGIVLSIALAWLTTIAIERPLRFGSHGSLKTAFLCVLMALTGALGFGIFRSDGFTQRPIAVYAKTLNANIQWTELWDNNDCKKQYDIGPCLISKRNPSIMILGDSHANHLYPGLAEATDAGVFAGGTCPPLLDVFMTVSRNQADHPCASNDFVRKNLAILDRTPSIHTVVISAYWRPVLDGLILNKAEQERWGETTLHSRKDNEQAVDRPTLVLEGLTRTMQELQARGKHIIFVRDTPELVSDVRAYCLNRSELLYDTSNPDCTIPLKTYQQYREKEDALVAQLRSRFKDLVVIDPLAIFCDDTVCYVMKDNVPYLRDQHHLSISGSQLVGQQILEEAGLPGGQPKAP